MRKIKDIKFRAWAEKTVDVRWGWAYNKMENTFNPKEPSKSSDLWDKWYDESMDYLDECLEEWDKINNEKDRYIKSNEMIVNFMINEKLQSPYRYEILHVMQYMGIKDRNNTEMYEGDIFDIHQTVNGCSKFVVVWDGLGWSARYYQDNGDLGRLYEYSLTELYDLDEKPFELGKEIEVVGNIYEGIK